jgi:hypothetical protein
MTKIENQYSGRVFQSVDLKYLYLGLVLLRKLQNAIAISVRKGKIGEE